MHNILVRVIFKNRGVCNLPVRVGVSVWQYRGSRGDIYVCERLGNWIHRFVVKKFIVLSSVMRIEIISGLLK